MLTLTVQQLGDITVVCCKGRIVTGGAYSFLRDAVRRQTEARVVILDIAQVDRIDAGGLGVLLSLRDWARSRAIRFKLMNVTKNVDQLLVLTNLQRVFEFCSVPDLLCLLHRAASVPSRPSDQPHYEGDNSGRECQVEAEDNVASVWRSNFSVS